MPGRVDEPALRFLKGHGTENDFVLLPDPDGRLGLGPSHVRMLCNRRAGIGADGVLRVVLAAADEEAQAMASSARWFMDYRNADGSVAEMCGNGIRVFARYLVDEGYASAGVVPVATRNGVRLVTVPNVGDPEAEIGLAVVDRVKAPTVTVDGRTWTGLCVSLGNPHVVVTVDDLGDAGTLVVQPTLLPAEYFPAGANIEFVRDAGGGVAGHGGRHESGDLSDVRIAMRVWERGVGETRSCGTGACAAAVAALRRRGREGGRVMVDVPGGRLTVTERPDGVLTLAGPAVLVARGDLDEGWWAAAGRG